MRRLEKAEVLLRSLRDKLMRDHLSYLDEDSSQDLEIDLKTSHTDIVTKYDKMVEQYLYEEIKKDFPDDVFFTEEETQREIGENMWVVDPIDGTVNFAVQKYAYAISVAYYENQKESFGLVYDVVRDLMYKGVKGQGSYLNDKKLPMLSEGYNFNTELIDISYPAIKNFKSYYYLDFSKIDSEFLGHRACGSAALAICSIGAQTLGFYASFKLCCWDYVAAKIFLEELGGTCMNIFTDEFPLDDVKRPFFAAKNQDMLNEIYTSLQ